MSLRIYVCRRIDYKSYLPIFQANLAFIPDEHVEDFTEFCRINSGPLPVLHKSYESMDFNAEPLTDDFSDARTDAAGYDVYLEGHVR